ncbi:hypothetical protein GUITHDRAFT_69037 [Guillardia theta CCMP2712]|uniref:GST C-terminal domain-containing protein n=2 Tax=Guillardia theta TaxID=55529 RepID=L1JJ02_GUITC|nr:hypothetical protein GUITHDRAFT_69037 [Guillardia theta CCMP2712]EKX48075.1 hypothetical protein GUITHDRAFT_69037 [Guillardia theta CCMP2712]|eukprot:XP_005835055.1 hypothetical protein GUITHDRAFT_69037 [Guillardia theta CCMP2712]
MSEVNKVRPRTTLDEMDESGELKRKKAAWCNWVEPGSESFPPEKDRYHLYISYACPWAHRCLILLKMKGLEDAIGVSVVHPTWQRTKPEEDEHIGWMFRDPSDPPVSNLNGHGSFPCTYCIPDTVNNAKSIRELYEIAGDKEGKYTVPVLWDKKKKTIVSNESSDIILMFNSAFNSIAKNPDLDLYPEDLRKEIDEVNSWIYPRINDGVYRCGFAQKQDAYEKAFDALFESLDRVEEILSKKRYLVGDRITVADIRLFVTLIRFDPVYVVYFKTDQSRIDDYPNMFNYMKEIYQMPAIKPTVIFPHIKTHYLSSHPKLNYYGIIPKGRKVNLDTPHNRDNMTST